MTSDVMRELFIIEARERGVKEGERRALGYFEFVKLCEQHERRAERAV